ncbi:hypothetical protein [Trichoplusia ni ascovirus 2c]|uniref:hypothetical protein n=1 Tax=Trichoplusia ni ascovirus 2c TaxID=328615 RepID=UPI0000E44267|nr:hypothetical protein TNAV2c_gp143 [Trichoplusia ni ascovirus 2c]YP_803373.1 hypothetical protein TNAV2c_gp151 [Trichoplusia ni ascovirus 2c]ABF70660.1 hypothetical protein [Trichoplusia ni ascovirus 2c]ABF70667.1 hypothetical protein [Trichoplusia ni ascovirus 2c]AUS94258.1 hypothetical protein [Trichoplusia ni ascovirus 6b]
MTYVENVEANYNNNTTKEYSGDYFFQSNGNGDDGTITCPQNSKQINNENMMMMQNPYPTIFIYPINDDDNENNNHIKDVAKKVGMNIVHRIEGFAWGALEGAASGALTGVSVSGAGWWIAGTVGQMVGAIAGFFVGGIAGAGVGLLSDRHEVKAVMRDYRHAFGKIEYKDIAR